jgi:hypothetical protein
MSWAQRLRRVFSSDISRCPRCGGSCDTGPTWPNGRFYLLSAAIVWFGLWAVNRRRRWFTIGEVIFWDVIVLIIIQLVWLRWF